MASTPTPVDAVLVTAKNVIGPSHPQFTALGHADAQQKLIQTIKARVEQPGAAGRQPKDVDDLNLAMEHLAKLMVPLTPVLFPATVPVPAGTLPGWVQPFKLVKLKRENRMAQVQAIDNSNPKLPVVTYQIIRPRLREGDAFNAPQGGRTGGPEKVGPPTVNAGWAEYTEDPRKLYMGPTPSKSGPIGQAVIARMRAEGKIVGDKVRYGRDAPGNPLPPGQFQLYPISECAMGHVIDAVTWWNSNGRFTGPQSSEVQKFMTDPNNYEIEPGGPNSLRGALLGGRGGRYLPSAK